MPIRPVVRDRRPPAERVLRLPSRQVTWEQAVSRFLAEKRAEGCAESTLTRIYPWVLLGRARDFVEQQGFAGVADFDADAFRHFLIEAGGDGLAPRSLSIHHRTLKTFLRWAHDRGYLDDAGVGRVRGPKLPQDHPVGFTASEERQLLIAARLTPTPERDSMILELMLRTGLRRDEVSGLDVADLWDGENAPMPLLRVRKGKGKKDRIVPLDTATTKLSRTLRSYIDRDRPRSENPALFLTWKQRQERGDYERLGVEAISKLFQRLSAATGIHAHPHRCRHHFATRSIAAGVNPDALRRALGHSTMAMTLRYLSSTDADLLEEWARRRD